MRRQAEYSRSRSVNRIQTRFAVITVKSSYEQFNTFASIANGKLQSLFRLSQVMGNKGKTTHTGVYGAIKYECTEKHSKWM